MFIVPIDKISAISDLTKESVSSAAQTGNLPFQSIFQDAINNVKQTDSALNDELYKLATGESDDLHNLTIASSKATLSVQLLVQLRDKALDAYNEVMRMNV